MKLLRKEHFGGVLFDTDSLRYEFVSGQPASPPDRVLPARPLPPRTDILSAPIRVYFEITRRCNLTCRHCFVSSGPKSYAGVPRELIFTILDDLHEMNVFDLRFTGGEPTFRDDWFQILSRAKALGFSLSLNTNGVYPPGSAIIDELLSLELNQLTISIDGMEETHDRIRGQGAFRSSMASIERLHRGGASLRTNTVLTRDNVGEVPQLISLLAPFVKEMNFFYMRPVGRAVKLSNQHLDFDQHFRSSEETIALRNAYPNVRLMHFEQSFLERSIVEEELPFAELAMAPPYGSTTLGLNADGSMWPHGYTPYQSAPFFKLGQYPNVNLNCVWHESPVLDAVRGWLRSLMQRCRSCPEYRTRCPGLNFEMEVARKAGHMASNPYCISDMPVPELSPFSIAASSPKDSMPHDLHHIESSG